LAEGPLLLLLLLLAPAFKHLSCFPPLLLPLLRLLPLLLLLNSLPLLPRFFTRTFLLLLLLLLQLFSQPSVPAASCF
jgi:hypothetical protein